MRGGRGIRNREKREMIKYRTIQKRLDKQRSKIKRKKQRRATNCLSLLYTRGTAYKWKDKQQKVTKLVCHCQLFLRLKMINVTTLTFNQLLMTQCHYQLFFCKVLMLQSKVKYGNKKRRYICFRYQKEIKGRKKCRVCYLSQDVHV